MEEGRKKLPPFFVFSIHFTVLITKLNPLASDNKKGGPKTRLNLIAVGYQNI